MHWSRCMQLGHNPANEPAGFIVAAAANHVNQRIGAFGPFHQQRALLVREHLGSPLPSHQLINNPPNFSSASIATLSMAGVPSMRTGRSLLAAGNNGVAVGCQPPSHQIFAECFAHTICSLGMALLFS